MKYKEKTNNSRNKWNGGGFHAGLEDKKTCTACSLMKEKEIGSNYAFFLRVETAVDESYINKINKNDFTAHIFFINTLPTITKVHIKSASWHYVI